MDLKHTSSPIMQSMSPDPSSTVTYSRIHSSKKWITLVVPVLLIHHHSDQLHLIEMKSFVHGNCVIHRIHGAVE